ncbi:putative pyridoxine 5'-phosphate oxidase superfamily flavin-nucleotide-binding protein [Rhizobium aquaticum]|uniref:Pyridoxine 5'-phosphate oxidase superfamily flavin-nucleotide-binding protein n=1 Tax=Rhizobium aquaticum TaxID=1549636 RepID=A0ABV2J156_9HYPH
MSEALRADVSASVLCWLATADAEGHPNVSPKEMFTTLGDDSLVIADIASPRSVANIRINPRVCVSFVDVFRQRGFKVEGKASLVEQGHPSFETVAADLLQMAGPDFPIRAVIVVAIDKVSRIWAPSYRLFPERSLEERMQAAYDTYGVEPKAKPE